jgi:hypothetical protein
VFLIIVVFIMFYYYNISFVIYKYKYNSSRSLNTFFCMFLFVSLIKPLYRQLLEQETAAVIAEIDSQNLQTRQLITNEVSALTASLTQTVNTDWAAASATIST